MSYIAPVGRIVLYNDVPLDVTYDHTIYFASRLAQTTYFNTKTLMSFTNQMYTRVKRGVIRVRAPADELYSCNYLSFTNKKMSGTGAGVANGKTFYCFVTYVEYINNEVTELGFEIDPMQTWLPGVDYELGDSFVEREHTANDQIGSNLVPENLELGEYMTETPTLSGHLSGGFNSSSTRIVVAATFDKQYNDVGGGYYSNLYSGICFNDFTSATDANNFIQGAANKINGIVGVFIMPADFINSGTSPSFTVTKNKLTSNVYGGYTPKNNKLYTYPYNFMFVTDFQGKYKIYPYEYFPAADSTISFHLTGCYSLNPTFILAPIHYKGIGTGTGNNYETANYNEMITISGWPQCAFNTDLYKAWQAQVSASAPYTALKMGMNAGSAIQSAGIYEQMAEVGGGGEAAAVVGLLSIASSTANILSQRAQKQTLGHDPHGMQAGSALFSTDILDFGFFPMHIRQDFAKIIDDYFNMYGYATHVVKKPNIHVRTHWTYTKTVGCKILGSMPADFESAICKIFDHGITFWVNASEIGDYTTYINSPLGG
ncbi:MAG: hypothetical protein J6S67_19135 [Methanobrevibacter sp.]|nr:hypothetical protein [Methanobrevibacter sp.]